MIATRHKKVGRQQGFTLIEALIAFLILSVGLLGIVSLQAMAKTSQHQAIQRTRAVSLADALIERIRVNPAGVETYNIGTAAPVGSASLGMTEPTANCRDAACTPVELATHDLWAWEQALDGAMATITEGGNTTNVGGLVTPRGCVLFTPFGGRTRTGLITVVIQWQGQRSSTDGVAADGIECATTAVIPDLTLRRQVAVNTFVVDETEF
ncbi:MAG: type IV pilus modification protein PilV [Halioglobus sp.]